MKKVFLVVIIAFIHISTNGQIGIRTFDSGKISFAKKNSKNILNDINISENKFKIDIQKLPHFAISETNTRAQSSIRRLNAAFKNNPDIVYSENTEEGDNQYNYRIIEKNVQELYKKQAELNPLYFDFQNDFYGLDRFNGYHNCIYERYRPAQK
ncbi:hypothetical protein [Chryseobacterium sp. Mn2064]|uniref:hypothetical protein n=1 Tax=Chryseobacterium sp. Mn2064 TaxID=3395263 RepID=UPI003BEBDDF4